MNDSKQLIAIGLEAAEPSLIQEMVEAGRLPTIKAMTEKGMATRMRSCTEVSSGSTWASIISGVGPAKHGLGFYHRQLQAGTYNIVKRYASDMAIEPFWNVLGRRGKNVLVMDVPDSYLTPQFKGTLVVGWGAEGLNAPPGSYPQGLLKEIESRFGKHPLNGWYQTKPKNRRAWVEFANMIVEATKTRTNVYKWLLERNRFDMFFVGYPEPHWIGHYFWFLKDSHHPDYDAELASLCGDAIERVYEAVDEGLGAMSSAHRNADFMVFSNTGMGCNYSGQHLVQDILNRVGLGVNQKKNGGMNFLDYCRPQKLWGGNAIRKVESIVGLRMLSFMKRCIPEKLWDVTTRRFLQWGHGWETSKAFVIPNDQSAAIRINVQGREPQGTVEPGTEFQTVYEEIKTVLFSAINPATGECPVSEIFLTRDRYPGDNADEFGDITVNWKHDGYVFTLESPRFGRVEGILPDQRSGAHSDDAYFMATGPTFERSERTKDCTIEDVAPTVFRYFDEAIPDYMDGSPIMELFLDQVEKVGSR